MSADVSAATTPVVEVVAEDQLAQRARDRRSTGESVQTGWSLPDDPWTVDAPLVCSGVIDSEQTAGSALTAALRGCDLLVALGAELPARVGERFLADATDRGVVVTSERRHDAPALPITSEQAAILALLAEGTSIVAAAEQLYLSVRTCERRVGQARKALGVRSTAEAISLVLRHGERGGGI